MSNEMPKGATLAKNRDGLINEADLEKIKLQNEKSREVIKQNNLLKKQDDAEAMLHNSKILNALSRSLVKFFFSKAGFIVCVIAYISFNVCLHYRFGDEANFYIGLVDKIGLFVIIFILGKFLKDNISLLMEIFKK